MCLSCNLKKQGKREETGHKRARAGYVRSRKFLTLHTGERNNLAQEKGRSQHGPNSNHQQAEGGNHPTGIRSFHPQRNGQATGPVANKKQGEMTKGQKRRGGKGKKNRTRQVAVPGHTPVG